MYKPNNIAVLQPVVLHVRIDGKLVSVGVGGTIKVAAVPPKKDGYVIREATQKELKELHNRGHAKYIDHIPKKPVKKVKDEALKNTESISK